MAYLLLKTLVSAVLIVAISELSKRSSMLGGLLASLPFVSLLGFLWLYYDTRDTARIAALSTSILWLVLPSLVLFAVFPMLLGRSVPFYPALGLSILVMLAAYSGMLLVLPRFGVRL